MFDKGPSWYYIRPVFGQRKDSMSSEDLQSYIHVYCMFSFSDGRKEAGILINKYNIAELQVEYFFISHDDMNDYKHAFDNFDMTTCYQLSKKINTNDILNIHPVSLKDYKTTIQLASLNTNRVNLNN